jgi:hypothetical protein
MNLNKDTNVNESIFDDIREYQEITDAKDIYKLLGDIIILDRYKDNIDYLFDRVVDVATLCWGNMGEHNVKLQQSMIKFKVNIDDEITYEIPLNRFMVSLTFIKTVIEYIDKIDITKFILDGYMTEKMRGKIQDNISETLLGYGHSIPDVQERLANMMLSIKELLIVFSHADMQIFTAENLFLDHYRDSEIIREINNTQYPPDMQTADIVEENKRRYELLEAEMIRLGNPFFLDNRFTKIIKPKQMEELYINFSQIPDGRNIVPVIMNGNGFKAGYHDLPVFYAAAIAARVPDIMNNEYMGSAGYFARNLMILTYGTLSKTVYDCGSKNPIPITVDDTVLNMFEGRFYYNEKNDGRLHILKKCDKHLLGKKLWFRTPCTCNLNEDVCHVCYGTVALKVGELNGGFIYTTNLLTSRVSQNILSAKHLLKTNAERIEYSESFNKYFTIDSSAVIPNDEKRFDIYIPEDYQDEISEHLTFYIGKDLEPITISNYASIMIPDNIIDECKDVIIDDKRYYKITSHKVIELGETFCIIIPINLMMTQKYMNIMNLFESGISKYTNIEEVVVELMNLMYGTIPLLSVHGEIIIRDLIRDVNQRLLRPNWLKEIKNYEYQLTRLKTALQNVESFTTAMAFEKTRHHIADRIFDERAQINRVGPASFTDYFFGQDTL